MPAPNAIRTPVAALLDKAWEAMQAGTLDQQEFIMDSLQVIVAGRSYVIQVAGEPLPYPRFILRVKQL